MYKGVKQFGFTVTIFFIFIGYLKIGAESGFKRTSGSATARSFKYPTVHGKIQREGQGVQTTPPKITNGCRIL